MATEATHIQAARRPRLRGRRRQTPRVVLNEPKARAPRLRRALRAAGFAVVTLALCTTAAFAYLYWHYSTVVDERLAAGYLTSRAGIYAAPRVLRTGQKLSPERLAAILRRAGYVDAGDAGNVWSGQFRMEDDAVRIEPSPTSPAGSSQGFESVRVNFKGGHVREIDADGAPLSSYTLEPETLTNDSGLKTRGRDALAYADIPPRVARAVLAIEDRRFFEHGGVDLWAVARAALSWGRAGVDETRQGG